LKQGRHRAPAGIGALNAERYDQGADVRPAYRAPSKDPVDQWRSTLTSVTDHTHSDSQDQRLLRAGSPNASRVP